MIPPLPLPPPTHGSSLGDEQNTSTSVFLLMCVNIDRNPDTADDSCNGVTNNISPPPKKKKNWLRRCRQISTKYFWSFSKIEFSDTYNSFRWNFPLTRQWEGGMAWILVLEWTVPLRIISRESGGALEKCMSCIKKKKGDGGAHTKDPVPLWRD